MKLPEWKNEETKTWLKKQMTGTIRNYVEDYHKEIKYIKLKLELFEKELKERYSIEEFAEMKEWLKKEWYKF